MSVTDTASLIVFALGVLLLIVLAKHMVNLDQLKADLHGTDPVRRRMAYARLGLWELPPPVAVPDLSALKDVYKKYLNHKLLGGLPAQFPDSRILWRRAFEELEAQLLEEVRRLCETDNK